MMLINTEKMTYRPLYRGKEESIKNFNIILDKTDRHRFQPGDEVTGTVRLEICSPVEICFLEFLVCGYAVVFSVHASQGLSYSKRETYINKRMLVLGSADRTKTMIIIPGRYNSKFSFKLPKNLPSTCSFEDKQGCLTFQARYFVQARLCDGILHGTFRGISTRRKTIVKVLMSRKKEFLVEHLFDISAVPMAMWPVSHTEELFLGCGPFDAEKLTVTAKLDRSVYLVGDVVHVAMETSIQQSRHFKSFRCELRQKVSLKKTSEVLQFMINSVTVRNPTWKIERVETEHPLAVCRMVIPTEVQMLPTFLDGCTLLKVSYSVRVSARFTNQAAQVALCVPLSFGPTTIHAHTTEDDGSPEEMTVPIFNRPIRFPRFSETQQASEAAIQSSVGNSSAENSTNPSSQSSQNKVSHQRKVHIQVNI